MEKIPMTPEGLSNLEDELRRLKTKDRPEIIAAIAEAREHGDLSENAEYHAARERQSFTEGRIKELESLISCAQVIDVSKIEGTIIRFGATVVLADDETDEEKTYQIVGDHEADLKKGRISISSPIAKALIGKDVGDGVEVAAPGGSRSYEVISVKYKK